MAQAGITKRIVERVASATIVDMPGPAVKVVDDAMLDAIGIAHMGYEFVGPPFVQYAQGVGGVPEATVIGAREKFSSGLAAGLNSTFGYNSNLMESGPGDHIFDALAQTGIAVGERVGASGAQIAVAVALGYELNAAFYKAAKAKDRHGYINTKKHTPVCVAMTAGKLLGLDAEQLHRAFGIAWMIEPPAMDLSLKLNVFTGIGSMFNLMICQLGTQAAMLAQNGVLGPLNVMEQDVLYDFDEFERRFTPDFYHVAQELQLKPWLGSRTSTGCIQLVLELVDDHQIAVEEIREVVVNAHRFYQNPPFGIVHPKSYFEGCFSVPWIVANALLGHQPGPDWVVPEAFLDERRQSMAGKVTVGEHPEAVAMWATGKALGNPDVPLGVEIKTNRGVLTKEMRYWQILGSPRNPMSQAQLDAKFLRLASRVIGAEKAHRLLAKTKRWHKIENVREISSLY